MRRGRTTFGAFNQDETPRIACFNKATVDLGVDFEQLIAALQKYVDEHVDDLPQLRTGQQGSVDADDGRFVYRGGVVTTGRKHRAISERGQ